MLKRINILLWSKCKLLNNVIMFFFVIINTFTNNFHFDSIDDHFEVRLKHIYLQFPLNAIAIINT